MSYDQHYKSLFADLEKEFGTLDAETVVATIGFSAGGPVNLCRRLEAKLFVTCELSVYDKQKTSMDGIKFELFSKDDFDETTARAVFTAIGNLSMHAQLGHRHTVDVTIAETSVNIVMLELFSTTDIDGQQFGLYRVRPH